MQLSIFVRNKVDISNWKIKLLYVLIFLFGLGFLDIRGIIVCGALLLAFVCFPRTKVDITMLSLLFFGAFYTLSLYMHGNITLDQIIKFLILPAGTYYIGFIIADNESVEGTTYRLATVLTLGFFIHSLLNMSSFIEVFGVDFSVPHRKTFEFWKNNEVLSVTVSNLYSAPMVGYSIGVIFSHKSIVKRIMAIVALGAVVFTMLLYQNRTTIVVIAFLFALTIIFDFAKKGLKSKLLWLMLLVGVCIAFILFFDIAGIKTFIWSTTLFDRIQGDPNSISRFAIWVSFLSGDWWKYPFGGKSFELMGGSANYVHNLWLDTWWNTGFIPFVFLLTFTIKLISQVISLNRDSKVFSYKNIVVLYLLGGLLINFGVEPVLEANPFVFLVTTFLSGSMQADDKKMRGCVSI